MIVADAGYRTPAIAHELLEDGIEPLFPYKSPMTKDGFFRKYEYVYDEGYDCCLCPENQILSYRTTNRDGYREYQSCPEVCAKCPSIHKCTESKNHVKVIMRHVWEEYMEMAEDIRHTLGNKEIYELRKETIERIFGTAKEQHGFRYTQYIGKARMEMKAGLTFACMNLKKLARILENRASKTPEFFGFLRFLVEESLYVEKWCWKQSQHQLCLQSDHRMIILWYFYVLGNSHPVHYLLVMFQAGCHVNPCCLYGGMSKNIRQMCQIFLDGIKALCKQMPEIMRKHL